MGNLCSGNGKVEHVEEPQKDEEPNEGVERSTVARRRRKLSSY